MYVTNSNINRHPKQNLQGSSKFALIKSFRIELPYGKIHDVTRSVSLALFTFHSDM